jgi:hypothetical protein
MLPPLRLADLMSLSTGLTNLRADGIADIVAIDRTDRATNDGSIGQSNYEPHGKVAGGKEMILAKWWLMSKWPCRGRQQFFRAWLHLRHQRGYRR